MEVCSSSSISPPPPCGAGGSWSGCCWTSCRTTLVIGGALQCCSGAGTSRLRQLLLNGRGARGCRSTRSTLQHSTGSRHPISPSARSLAAAHAVEYECNMLQMQETPGAVVAIFEGLAYPLHARVSRAFARVLLKMHSFQQAASRHCPTCCLPHARPHCTQILLGADGPFSIVRSLCVQDSAPAFDVSYCCRGISQVPSWQQQGAADDEDTSATLPRLACPAAACWVEQSAGTATLLGGALMTHTLKLRCRTILHPRPRCMKEKTTWAVKAPPLTCG